MKLFAWLKTLGHPGDTLPGGSYVPLLTSSGEESGAIVVHSLETRDLVLRALESDFLDTQCVHDGYISSFLWDQLSGAAGIINASVQSGQLLQIIGKPELLEGIKQGALSILRDSGGSMTGTVVSEASKKIAGQLRFSPASCAPVVAPLAAWQVLHAIAGVAHLQKINARLDSLQRSIERLTFRLQAQTLGQVAAAVATLEELNLQFKTTGTFSQDMVVRLAIADRDIQAALSEQRFLVQRFTELGGRIIRQTDGKDGAVKANQILKEESPEFLLDAKILTAAAKASLLSSQAWLRHDLEHNPRNVAHRLRDLDEEMEQMHTLFDPLTIIDELDQHAKGCIEELNWFRRNLFNRSLAKEIRNGRNTSAPAPQPVRGQLGAPTVLVWKGQNNIIQSVVVEVCVES
jgi:hypothetical protein